MESYLDGWEGWPASRRAACVDRTVWFEGAAEGIVVVAGDFVRSPNALELDRRASIGRDHPGIRGSGMHANFDGLALGNLAEMFVHVGAGSHADFFAFGSADETAALKISGVAAGMTNIREKVDEQKVVSTIRGVSRGYAGPCRDDVEMPAEVKPPRHEDGLKREKKKTSGTDDEPEARDAAETRFLRKVLRLDHRNSRWILI